MSLRTPLGAVLGHGSAHHGVAHWWAQRVSAIALVPLTVWLLWSLARLPLADRASVGDWLAQGWHPILLALSVLVFAWHSLLGVQVVIEDYVHSPGVRLKLLLLSRFAHALLATGGVYAVLRVALTAA
jgi:succinate dehydrogenase / fumarate reductase membrane anchor subunit